MFGKGTPVTPDQLDALERVVARLGLHPREAEAFGGLVARARRDGRLRLSARERTALRDVLADAAPEDSVVLSPVLR